MTTETEIAERLARLIQSYGPKSLEFERLHAAFKLGEEASLARIETLRGLLRESRVWLIGDDYMDGLALGLVCRIDAALEEGK